MDIGIFHGDMGSGSLQGAIDGARRAHDDGFTSYWLPHIFALDAISTAGLIGAAVPEITIGTAVVPTYPRHPVTMAQQTLTTQAASGNRFLLGIGLSHQVVIENMFGFSFDKPARHMSEYLDILLPALRGEQVAATGETLSANGVQLTIADASAPPVLLAALAPRMLALAGSRCDGTITWMTGPKTISSHIAPSLAAAADKAGRPSPQIVCGLPICVTDDPAGARERCAQLFQIYGFLPSYRAMLDREGAAGPADVAIVGSEDAVATQIADLYDAGVTTLSAVEFAVDPDEQARTRTLLKSLL